MDWNITGHKRQLEFLEKTMNAGKLAHGYLFAGPDGVGKKTIAKKLAAALLNIEQDKFSPDLLELDGKEGIKIEQIRDLIFKLSLKAYSAPYKVAIIDEAHEMTMEAANALLKVLEEPKAQTIIILITSNPNRLPKTIVSRAQKITFGPIQTTQDLEDEDSKRFYETFKNSTLVDRLLVAAEIADLETVDIKKVLQNWLTRMQQELLTHTSKRLAHKISEVMQAYKYVEGNVNSKLLLTNLMLST